MYSSPATLAQILSPSSASSSAPRKFPSPISAKLPDGALVSSVKDSLIPEIEYLCTLGISHRETRSVVLRSPGLFTFSIKNNFKPKVEFLLHGMGRYLFELKEFPQCFSFNLERKIKPRHPSLKESQVWMLLSGILKVSDGGVHSSVNGDAIFC